MTEAADDFETRFLDLKRENAAHDGWHDVAIQRQFEKKLREKLTGTAVTWINPVAKVLFYHPENLMRGAGMAGNSASWNQYVKNFLYRPVAIDEGKQSEIEAAHAPLVQSMKEGPDKHLSRLFEGTKFTRASCFRCSAGRDGKIAVLGCGSRDQTGSIDNYDEYEKLLTFSGGTIWFVPAPLLSLESAKSEIHNEYLVGAYFGLNTNSGHEGCACQQVNGKVLEAINWATNLFFLRRLRDQGNELRRYLEQYAKQMHMLRLLEEPLSQLSSALEKTQEQSQTLRAILYDPARSIFAVAPRTWKYFEEGRKLRCGAETWLGFHQPGNASTPEELISVRLTITAIVLEVFGKVDPDGKIDSELIKRYPNRSIANVASALLSDETDKVFSDLKGMCKALVGNVLGSSEVSEDIAICGQWLKDILYRPYKDGDPEHSHAPLCAVVFGSFEAARLNVNNGGEVTSLRDALGGAAFDQFDKNVFLAGLPVPRYAQWLSMLLGILAYAKVEKRVTNISVVVRATSQERPSSLFEVQFDSDTDVYIESELPDLYQEMQEWCGNRNVTLSALGNFKKPFLDFALLAAGKPIKQEGFAIECGPPDDPLIHSIKLGTKSFCYEVISLPPERKQR